MPRSSRKIEIALVAVGLTLGGIFVALILMARTASVPRLSVVLLGYTNDAAGVRFVQFSITNLNTATAMVYSPSIETNGSYGGYSLPDAALHSLLRPGESKIFAFPAPTNQPQWRLEFFCYPTVGARRVITGFGGLIMNVFHVGPRFQTMPYDIQSGWVVGGNSTNVVTNAVLAP